MAMRPGWRRPSRSAVTLRPTRDQKPATGRLTNANRQRRPATGNPGAATHNRQPVTGNRIMNSDSPDNPAGAAKRVHAMTPARWEALRKATRASARMRHERAVERKREWHRNNGYWFFHRWALHVVPFTKGVRRLGESVSGFVRLLALAERWLGRSRRQGPEDGNQELEGRSRKTEAGSQEPEDRSQGPESRFTPELQTPNPEPLYAPSIYPGRGDDIQSNVVATPESVGANHEPPAPSPEPRTPNPNPRIASKVARALAQVLWLRPRVLRERALDRSIRFEARLRTVAELQGILHGRAGPEEEARRRAEMRRLLSAETLTEYKQMRTLGMDPADLWPKRLAWRIALRLREVFEDRFDRERDLAALRRRTALLLEAYETAAAIEAGTSGVASGSGSASQPCLADPSPASHCSAPPPPGRGGTRLGGWVRGDLEAEERARLRKHKAVRRVEESPAESLGNPFVAPRQVGRRLGAEVRRGSAPPRAPSPASLRPAPSPAGRGETPMESRPRLVMLRRYWDRTFGWCAELSQGARRFAVRLSEMSAGREDWGWPVVRELEWRAEVESRRRPKRIERAPGLNDQPARAGLRARPIHQRVWTAPAIAVPGDVSAAGQAQGPAPTGGSVAGRPQSDARTPNTEFTYPEVKRLLAEAFGVAPGWPIDWRYTPPCSREAAAVFDVASPRRPAPRGVIERKLERVARLVWLMLGSERRRAGQELAKLEQILASARPGEFEPTARALRALEAADREADFRFEDRLAHLTDALRRLVAAIYDGYREFRRLEADPVWFDAGRKRAMRQDLGLEPLPAGFETPEPPAEFVAHRRRFLAGLENLCAEREEAWKDAVALSYDS